VGPGTPSINGYDTVSLPGHMLSLVDALEMMRRAVFRLRIEKNSEGMWEWGTAFFVGNKTALTAYHNLPSDQISSGRCVLSAFREGEWFNLTFSVTHSLRESEGDIAVLELSEAMPAGAAHLNLGYVPDQIPRRDRVLTWAGRPVCAFGFPFQGASQEGRLVPGLIDSTQPLVECDWKEQRGRGPGVIGWTDWLRIHADDNATRLEGISGAPILDRETHLVIGVQHSYVPGLKVVYGTELANLARVWPAFEQFARSIPVNRAGGVSEGFAASLQPETLQIPSARGLLPPPPRMFVGRGDVIADLLLRLTSLGAETEQTIPRIVVVRGTPGVGKTSLAAALAHNSQLQGSFPDGILWASLGQFSNATTILEDWLSAMSDSRVPPGLSTANLQGRLTSILSRKRVLLLIDDVWDARDAEPLRLGGANCATLMTTREPEAAIALARDLAYIYPLSGLSMEKGIELLIALAPWIVLQYSDEAYAMVEDFAGLPLAIHVAAQLLNSEMHCGFGGTTVPGLLDEIRNGAALLKAKPPSDRGVLANETSVESVAVLLELSTNRLSDQDRMQFALLGAMAPKPATFDMDLIQAVWATPDPKPTIRTLVNRGLLEPAPKECFQMHYLLVLHARELAAKLEL